MADAQPLVVSVEAIFLLTFVIGQNRAAAFQQAKADHDVTEQEAELKANTQLTREVHVLTAEWHRRVVGSGGARDGAEATTGTQQRTLSSFLPCRRTVGL